MAAIEEKTSRGKLNDDDYDDDADDYHEENTAGFPLLVGKANIRMNWPYFGRRRRRRSLETCCC